ncbi:MAG: type II toxin-antitoxin system ParD family antitoxin [Rickettsiales bacterium]|nr:type II toxin-antitoxin system ParD family antitoxin [Rickettsiales bacterium]
MSVELAPNIEAAINNKVQSGYYKSANDVVIEALTLLDKQHALKMHIEKLLDEGEASMANGEFYSPEQVDAHIESILNKYR